MTRPIIITAAILAITGCAPYEPISDQVYKAGKGEPIPQVASVFLRKPRKCSTAQQDFEGMHRTCGDEREEREEPAVAPEPPAAVQEPNTRFCVSSEGC